MTRTIAHDHQGPAELKLRLPAGKITVTADEATTSATITLRPVRDGDETAERAIAEAEVAQDGAWISVKLDGAAGGGTILSSGGGVTNIVSGVHGGTIVQSAGDVVGGISMSGGEIRIGGRVVSSDGPITVVQGSSGVLADLQLPAGSSVRLDVKSADISVRGPVADVEADSNSGDVDLDQARTVELSTGSGDVWVRRGERIEARTGHGDITVDHLAGPARLSTGSGNIRVHAAREGRLKAKTGSGNITVTAEPGARIERDNLSSSSGSIRTP